jgi:AmmeMemoRadiSam system protein B
MTSDVHIRPPSVAGMFYPGDANELSRRVDELLASVDVPLHEARGARPRLLVSPHAGYPYSGRVAAHGFRAASLEAAPRTVVVVGPSHVEYFDFSSVFVGEGYETPLGVVAVDRDLAQRLCSGLETVRASDRGHVQPHLPRGEHSLEVQLPFLQRAFGDDVRIVPIVMGDQSWRTCVELGEALRAAVDEGALIVASTDLSHFYDARRAAELDGTFCSVLSSMDARALANAVDERRCEACGAGPVVASLLAVEPLSRRGYHELSRAHSGEVTGDNSSVVGYLSAAVSTSP